MVSSSDHALPSVLPDGAAAGVVLHGEGRHHSLHSRLIMLQSESDKRPWSRLVVRLR